MCFAESKSKPGAVLVTPQLYRLHCSVLHCSTKLCKAARRYKHLKTEKVKNCKTVWVTPELLHSTVNWCVSFTAGAIRNVIRGRIYCNAPQCVRCVQLARNLSSEKNFGFLFSLDVLISPDRSAYSVNVLLPFLGKIS